MPILKNPRWEQFCLILANPHPPSNAAAFRAAGFKGDSAHANRLIRNPLVAARLAELKARADKIQAAQSARAEANAIAAISVSRQSLMRDTAAALKVAENAGNATAMIAALRFMAELAQISLKAPDDVKQPTQHLHLHEAASLIDRPPTETLEQWIERKRLEADARATAKLKLVGKT